MENSQDIWDDSVGEVMKGGIVYLKQDGDYIHGYYKGCYPAIGKFGPSFLHKAIGIGGFTHDKEGNKIPILKGMPYEFWDASFWHDEIELVLDGQEFALRYNGKKVGKTSGNEYNDWTLKRLPGMQEAAPRPVAPAAPVEDPAKPDIFADTPFAA